MVDAVGTVIPALAPITSDNPVMRSVTKAVIDYGTPIGGLVNAANKVAELFGGQGGKSLGDVVLGAGDSIRSAGNRAASTAIDYTTPGLLVNGANRVAEAFGGQGGKSLGETIMGGGDA